MYSSFGIAVHCGGISSERPLADAVLQSAQSAETNPIKMEKLVGGIELKIARDAERSITIANSLLSLGELRR